MPTPSNFIFDLDGTLIDSFPGIERAIRGALADVCPERSVENWRSFVGPPIREMFRRGLGLEDDALPAKLEQAFRVRYDGGDWKETRPYDGVRETLAALRELGSHLFVLTNKPPLPTERILQHLGLRGFFAEVLAVASRQPPFKNKAEAADDLRRRWKLTGVQTLLVGDSKDDAEAAAFCGFRFAAISYGYGTAPEHLAPGTGCLVHRFCELLPNESIQSSL